MTCLNDAVGAVQALPGVAKVDGHIHSFVVVYNPSQVTVERLTQVIESNDFRVTGVTAEP